MIAVRFSVCSPTSIWMEPVWISPPPLMEVVPEDEVIVKVAPALTTVKGAVSALSLKRRTSPSLTTTSHSASRQASRSRPSAAVPGAGSAVSPGEGVVAVLVGGFAGGSIAVDWSPPQAASRRTESSVAAGKAERVQIVTQ